MCVSAYLYSALGGRLPPPRKHDGGGLVGRHGGGGLSEGYLRAGAATRPAFVLVMTDDKVAYEPHRVGADLIVSDLFTLRWAHQPHEASGGQPHEMSAILVEAHPACLVNPRGAPMRVEWMI